MKLATKLIIVFSLLLTVAMAGLAVFLGIYLTKHQRDQKLRSLYSLVKMADVSYEGFKHGLEIRAIDWASDGYIRETTEKLLSARGREKEAVAGQLSDYFREKKLIYDPAVMMLEVLDKEGIVIASSRKERIGADESEEKNRFKDAIGGNFGEAFVESVVFEADEDPEKFMNHVTTRIFSISSTKGNPVPLSAVLLFHFGNTDRIKEALAGGKMEGKDVKNAILLEHYDSADIYLVNSDRLMSTPSRFVEGAVLKQRVDTPPVRACLENRKDFNGEYVNYLGKRVLGAAECVDEGRNVIVFEVEKQEALSFMADLYIQLAVGTLVTVFLGVVIITFVSHGFTKDLVVLTDEVQKMANKNDFSARAKVPLSPEAGLLASVFNSLLDNLDKSRKNVEESNLTLAEKVNELERTNQLMVGRELKMVELKKRIIELEKKH